MTPQIKQRFDQIQRGEVPKGYKRTKAGVVPIEWEETRLARYLVVNSDKNISLQYGKDDVFSISGELGIVNQIELLGRSYAGVSVEPYGIVYPDNVVYTKSPLKANPYGIIKTNKTGKTGIVSTLYAIFRCNDNVCPDFVQSYFELDQNLNNYLYPIVNIGAKHDMKISDENSLKGWVVFPPLDEQKKIAEILSAQDKLIALKEKLIEEKKRQKKYLMQQLLTGKKRLPGFSGEWSEIKLFQISKKITEKNTGFKYTVVYSNSAQHGIVPQTDQFDRDIANEENIDRYYVVKNGDFVYNPRISVTAPCGPINVNHNENIGVMSPLYTVFSVSSERIDNDYLEQYFKSSVWFKYMKSIANYGARHDRMSITDDDFFEMPIRIGSVDEQKAIRKILVAADMEIEEMEIAIDLEKQKKKALMQLLLTGIVRVNA